MVQHRANNIFAIYVGLAIVLEKNNINMSSSGAYNGKFVQVQNCKPIYYYLISYTF